MDVDVGGGVGVSVSGAVGGGVFVGVVVGVAEAGGDTGVVGLRKENSRMARRMITTPIDNKGFLVRIAGSLSENFFAPVDGGTGLGAPPSATSNLFTALAYSSRTKST